MTYKKTHVLNVDEAMRMAAQGVPLKEGDEVVVHQGSSIMFKDSSTQQVKEWSEAYVASERENGQLKAEIERLRYLAQSRYELLRECQSEFRAIGATGLVETIDAALKGEGN